MSDPIRHSAAATDIAQLEQASAMKRSANLAFARDDVVTLTALGFSYQHIGEL